MLVYQILVTFASNETVIKVTVIIFNVVHDAGVGRKLYFTKIGQLSFLTILGAA